VPYQPARPSADAMQHDAHKFVEMRAMGFTDDVMIDRALARAGGNVESAVEMLFEGVIPTTSASAEIDSVVVRLAPNHEPIG
jgi:hypothetical protein